MFYNSLCSYVWYVCLLFRMRFQVLHILRVSVPLYYVFLSASYVIHTALAS